MSTFQQAVSREIEPLREQMQEVRQKARTTALFRHVTPPERHHLRCARWWTEPSSRRAKAVSSQHISASVDDHSAALAAEASSSLQPASSELVATTPPIATLAPTKVRRFSSNLIGLCRGRVFLTHGHRPFVDGSWARIGAARTAVTALNFDRRELWRDTPWNT